MSPRDHVAGCTSIKPGAPKPQRLQGPTLTGVIDPGMCNIRSAPKCLAVLVDHNALRPAVLAYRGRPAALL
jgi:hypothetical protein